MNLYVLSAFAGLFFGIWPLFMNRSGLTGGQSSAVFALACLIGVLPFALKNISNVPSAANWPMIIAAGVTGALGLLAFNGMLAKAAPNKVGCLFIMMIVVQTAIPAVYQVVMNGSLPLTKGLGFLAAISAAVLLLL